MTRLRRLRVSRLWVCSLVGAVALTIGCGRDKAHPAPTANAPALKTCASNRDCDDGWACLAGRCYDTRKSAAFTHPEQQVTPDRVRQEVEQQQARHMQRIDKDMKDSDLPAN